MDDFNTDIPGIEQLITATEAHAKSGLGSLDHNMAHLIPKLSIP